MNEDEFHEKGLEVAERLLHGLEVAEILPHGSAYFYNAFGMSLPTLIVGINLCHSTPLSSENPGNIVFYEMGCKCLPVFHKRFLFIVYLFHYE